MQNINYTFLTTQDWNSRMSAIVKKYSSDPNSVDLSDATCPICLCLYMSPVKLPCDHVLCEGCFTSTVNNTNLVCPICRKRISVWCRNASKVIFWSVLYTGCSLKMRKKELRNAFLRMLRGSSWPQLRDIW